MTSFTFSIEEYDTDHRAYVGTEFLEFPSWEEAEEYCFNNNTQRNGSFLTIRYGMIGKYICHNKQIFNEKKFDLYPEES